MSKFNVTYFEVMSCHLWEVSADPRHTKKSIVLTSLHEKHIILFRYFIAIDFIGYQFLKLSAPFIFCSFHESSSWLNLNLGRG